MGRDGVVGQWPPRPLRFRSILAVRRCRMPVSRKPSGGILQRQLLFDPYVRGLRTGPGAHKRLPRGL